MRSEVRKCLIIVLAAVFLIAGAWLLVNAIQQQQAKQTYLAAQELAANIPEQEVPAAEEPEEQPEILVPEEEPDPIAEALALTDLAALREVNPEVIGWIEIPDTAISYPLMQGDDNDYYLKHSWEGASSSAGSIYMDYRNDALLGDFNTIIYGHRMGDGTMFRSLHDYKDLAHWEENPAVYLVTDEGVARYEIFAAYEADAVKKHTYRLGLEEAEGQQAYINYCTNRSVIDTGLVPEPGDHILTLSTCTKPGSDYTTRWVVQAYLPAEKGE